MRILRNGVIHRGNYRARKFIKIKGFFKHHMVRSFLAKVSTHRTNFLVINYTAQCSIQVTEAVCCFCWRVEQLHCEIYQVRGLKTCRCCKARIQRNHIDCALLIWARLNQLAAQTCTTIYQLKQRLLDDYLFQWLKTHCPKINLA